MWTLLLFAAVLSLGACNSKNKEDDSKEVAEEQNDTKFEDTEIENDTEFAVEAADAGLFEVQLAQLALTNGTSSEVKTFAQTMIDEHSKANEELKGLAQQKNISLPTAISDKCQKKYNDLAEKKGIDFDDAYTDLMVKDHKDAIDNFKKEADKGKDADIKSWAAQKVTALEHHLEMAKAAEKAVDDKK
jgi:putative membrane protein